jgi:hypothetical protein
VSDLLEFWKRRSTNVMYAMSSMRRPTPPPPGAMEQMSMALLGGRRA